MGTPLYKQLTNDKTGEQAWFAVDDDGSHHRLSAPPSEEQRLMSEFEHMNPDMEIVGPSSFIDSRKSRGMTKAETDAQQAMRLKAAVRDMQRVMDQRANAGLDLKSHYELHNKYEIAKSKAVGALAELSHNNTEHGKELDAEKMPSYLNPDAPALLKGAEDVYNDAARAIMGVYGVRIRETPRVYSPDAQIGGPETKTAPPPAHPEPDAEPDADTDDRPPAPPPENPPVGNKPEPDRPWYDTLTNAVGDRSRAAMAGATLGTSREAAGYGAELASLLGPKDPEGYTRNYRAGSEQADVQGSEQRANVKAQAEHPNYAAAGTMLPIVASMGLPTPAAVAEAPWLARVAYGANVAGLAGGVQSLENAPLNQKADAFTEGYNRGSEGGALLGTGAEALGGAARFVGRSEQPLTRTGWWLRGKAVNAPDDLGSATDAIGQRPGEYPATAVGRRVEEFGLPERYARPMTSGDYASAAETRAEGSGYPLGEVLDSSSVRGVSVPKSEIIDELEAVRAPHARGTTPDEAAKSNLITHAERRIGKGSAPEISARGVHDMKTKWERQGGYRKGEAPPTPRISARKEAAREVAGVLRDQLHGAIRERAPENYDAFQRHNDDVAAARAIQSYASGPEGQSGLTRPMARALLDSIPGAHLVHGAADMGLDAGASLAHAAARGAGATRRFGMALRPPSAAAAITVNTARGPVLMPMNDSMALDPLLASTEDDDQR